MYGICIVFHGVHIAQTFVSPWPNKSIVMTLIFFEKIAVVDPTYFGFLGNHEAEQ
jgi:hypothetical protein